MMGRREWATVVLVAAVLFGSFGLVVVGDHYGARNNESLDQYGHGD